MNQRCRYGFKNFLRKIQNEFRKKFKNQFGTLTGTRMVHGRWRLYGRRAAQYGLDVRSVAGRRLAAGGQGRAGGHGRVAGSGTGDTAAASGTAAAGAVYRWRHFAVVVVVVDRCVVAATGRLARRFRAAASGAAGRIVVPRRTFFGAVVVLLLVLLDLLPTLGPTVLEPDLRKINRVTHKN